MLNDELRAETDQAAAALGEMCPEVWWNIFDGCVKKGFTRQEALRLIEAYIMVTLDNI